MPTTTPARALLRDIGIEPVIRHGEELAAVRNPTPATRRQYAVARVRRIVLLLVLAAVGVVMLRYMHVF